MLPLRLSSSTIEEKKKAIGKITAIADFEHQKLSVEEYNSMKKFDEFLKLSEFYSDE